MSSNGIYLPQNNIQQVFQRLHALLQEEYSGEDLQIVACPSMEQVQRCEMRAAEGRVTFLWSATSVEER